MEYDRLASKYKLEYILSIVLSKRYFKNLAIKHREDILRWLGWIIEIDKADVGEYTEF